MTEATPTPTAPSRQRRIGPFVYSPRKRAAKARGDHFGAKVAAFVGVLLVIAHEIIYRQTGGLDFELYRTISHAGADMLFFTVAPIVFVLVLIEAGRIR